MASKYSFNDLCETAINVDGKCLNKEFKVILPPLKWRCKRGHTWEASYNFLSQTNFYCKHCEKLKHPEEVIVIANAKGGKCLSKKYIDNSTHLQFCCDKGHQWGANANNIKTGHWCPVCGTIINKKHSKSKSKPVLL